MPCANRIRINQQALVRLKSKVDKVEDRLRRMGLTVRSAAMSIERPDARLKERGNSCKGWNHFSSVCNQKTAVEDLEVRDEGSGDEGEGAYRYFLGATECPDSDPAWFVELDVNGNPVKWKLDSGADVSVMSQEMFKKMRERRELKPISMELSSLGGAVKPLGKFNAKTEFKGTKYSFS